MPLSPTPPDPTSSALLYPGIPPAPSHATVSHASRPYLQRAPISGHTSGSLPCHCLPRLQTLPPARSYIRAYLRLPPMPLSPTPPDPTSSALLYPGIPPAPSHATVSHASRPYLRRPPISGHTSGSLPCHCLPRLQTLPPARSYIRAYLRLPPMPLSPTPPDPTSSALLYPGIPPAPSHATVSHASRPYLRRPPISGHTSGSLPCHCLPRLQTLPPARSYIRAYLRLPPMPLSPTPPDPTSGALLYPGIPPAPSHATVSHASRPYLQRAPISGHTSGSLPCHCLPRLQTLPPARSYIRAYLRLPPMPLSPTPPDPTSGALLYPGIPPAPSHATVSHASRPYLQRAPISGHTSGSLPCHCLPRLQTLPPAPSYIRAYLRLPPMPLSPTPPDSTSSALLYKGIIPAPSHATVSYASRPYLKIPLVLVGIRAPLPNQRNCFGRPRLNARSRQWRISLHAYTTSSRVPLSPPLSSASPSSLPPRCIVFGPFSPPSFSLSGSPALLAPLFSLSPLLRSSLAGKVCTSPRSAPPPLPPPRTRTLALHQAGVAIVLRPDNFLRDINGFGENAVGVAVVSSRAPPPALESAQFRRSGAEIVIRFSGASSGRCLLLDYPAHTHAHTRLRDLHGSRLLSSLLLDSVSRL